MQAVVAEEAAVVQVAVVEEVVVVQVGVYLALLKLNSQVWGLHCSLLVTEISK